MEQNQSGGTSVEDVTLLALALLAALVIWRVARRMPAWRMLLDRNLWFGAVVELALLPAAAYGLGQLVGLVLSWIGMEEARQIASRFFGLLVFLGAAVGLARLAEVWVLSQDRDDARTTLSQLSRSILYGLFIFFGFLLFMMVNDRSPTELYVGTGALAALVVFGLQQTLGDLFSGIAMSIERPFRIGDWLRLSDGTEGQVTNINWRATRLRGWDNTTYVVPNGELARRSFQNLHGPTHAFAPWYYVRISGDVDPKTATALLHDAALRCPGVLREPGPVARLVDGTTIPYSYMVWVHFENYPAMFAGREDLYREIHYGLQKAGLQIAAEIQEIRHRSIGPEASTIASAGGDSSGES